uniref:Dolichyl-diphosphooligosaccharide--protein glycosyltransferase subunit 2 n=1 Tax=Globodera rostochiensis TaxID=31243 RepID=A0A914GT10_GLORO
MIRYLPVLLFLLVQVTAMPKSSYPEPRPPVLLSDIFAVICAAPLVFLFILWSRIGLNFYNFKWSFWTLGFHLNMFETLQWLAFVGVFTLFCGNRLLHSFAVPKKSNLE